MMISSNKSRLDMTGNVIKYALDSIRTHHLSTTSYGKTYQSHQTFNRQPPEFPRHGRFFDQPGVW